MSRIGVILNNIGTPQSPEPRDVGNYLNEFLMDPDVIDLPWLFRFILVRAMIVPFRRHSSSAKYKSIWTERGSPLLVYTENMRQKLQEQLGSGFIVKIGMRFGEPSINQALISLKQQGVTKIIFAPLFPQFSMATTGSNVNLFLRLCEKISIETKILEAFYNEHFFLDPLSKIVKDSLSSTSNSHLLFSYHGLPEDLIKKNTGCLQSENCCQRANACKANCYKAQCHKTSELVAQKINLSREKWSTSFQSRLGVAKWIGPATLDEMKRLRSQGVKNLVVACPAFVTDCLETLEEIGIELRKEFINLGGESFTLAPCLNDDTAWVSEFAQKIKTL